MIDRSQRLGFLNARSIWAGVLAAGLSLALGGGCGDGSSGSDSAEPRIRIGFLVKQPEEPWFQNEWNFARQCAEQYGFEAITLGTSDGEKVLNAIDSLHVKQAQGFVICTPDVRLGPAIMAKANACGMKVFAVDDQFVGSDGSFMNIPYMGISARAIGKMVGQALFDEMQKRGWPLEGTAVCAPTFEELDTVKQRTDGAADALVAAGFPVDRIYRTAERANDVPGAFDAANIVLTQHPDVKRWLVFSVNDEGVLGAVRAMEGRGYGKETIIGIGIGANTARAEFEKEKDSGFFGTVLISPRRHGFETTEYLYKWIKDGVEPPMDTRTSGILITRETYEQVMREQGLWEK